MLGIAPNGWYDHLKFYVPHTKKHMKELFAGLFPCASVTFVTQKRQNRLKFHIWIQMHNGVRSLVAPALIA
ncbi:hypothetical protein L596_026201 [Steinernema carpocapsae]|uniref:Uncharacterized protein n=1 Tax=Steinernema carpocapsae TaxID=34508 RepID=A0A4U5M0R8_STECR|nr:hypothetical protein L596_026201 [Steinernema carpocapsae]